MLHEDSSQEYILHEAAAKADREAAEAEVRANRSAERAAQDAADWEDKKARARLAHSRIQAYAAERGKKGHEIKHVKSKAQRQQRIQEMFDLFDSDGQGVVHNKDLLKAGKVKRQRGKKAGSSEVNYKVQRPG